MRVEAPLRVIVADDEPLARKTLRLLLAADPEVVIVAECRDGREAIERTRALSPDLLVLDVQMPGLDGFDVIRALGRNAPPIVFVTAHDEHAIRAFDVHALDYVLKPFDDRRFVRAMERAKAHVRSGRVQELVGRLAQLVAGEDAGGPAVNTSRYADRIAVRDRRRRYVVPVEEIDWIEAADYYAAVHVGKKAFLVREPLSALEERLDPERFVRIHRSALVRVDQIQELRPVSPGEYLVVLRGGTELRLSRSRRAAVLELLGRLWKG